MNTLFCNLPTDLAADIERHASDVERFLKGELSASVFKARRVPRGIYEQRQNGTYMVRVRVPGGLLAAEQARTLADVAQRFARSRLHVTTRQDVQIHDVSIEQTSAVLRELLKAGLAAKGGGGNTVRNVTVCPYAGICPAELFEVTPCALAITQYLIALPGSFNLPRKYKIALSGCRADCAFSRVNDLGFIACTRDGRPGFAIYVGGGMGASSRVGDLIEDWMPAREAVRAAEAVRRLFDRLGDRTDRHHARLRFVFDRIGADKFRELFQAEMTRVRSENVADAPEPEVLTVRATVGPPPLRPSSPETNGLRVIQQRQVGFVAIPIALPLGFISSDDLRIIADCAERFGTKRLLRTTRTQGLLLPFIPPANLAALADNLKRLSIPIQSSSALNHFVVCAGATTCRLGLCDSRAAARACAAALDKLQLDGDKLAGLEIHLSGCPNACAQHPVASLGFFGTARRFGGHLVPGYQVILGGRYGPDCVRLGVSLGTVPARRLPDYLAALLKTYLEQRHGNESLADFFDRLGAAHFQEQVREYAAVPPYEEAPEFYRDWEQSEDFSLAGRGPGECGAGVFEAIAEDLATARKALREAATAAQPAQLLFDALLATARALLITRGFDSNRPDETFRAFETHFLDSGLVDSSFRGLLLRGRSFCEGWQDALRDREDEIRRLLDRIETLYHSMDADLRFHVPEAEQSRTQPQPPPAQADSSTPTAELDLRGVACPLNFVKAKLKLETLNSGETLSIVLDDGEPIRNVPASLRNEGHEVLDTRPTGDGHWRVLVRKRTNP